MNFANNDPFNNTRKAFKTMVDDLLHKSIGDLMGAEGVVTRPFTNVQDTGKSYVLEVAIPGLEKDQIHLSIEGNQLLIKGKKHESTEEKAENYVRREFNFAQFERRFSLPDHADTDHIEARLKNGVLVVTLGKVQEEAPKEGTKIPIQD